MQLAKIDWQPAPAVVFLVVFAIIAALVAAGKLQPEALLALLTWLAPAPWQQRSTPPSELPHQTGASKP